MEFVRPRCDAKKENTPQGGVPDGAADRDRTGTLFTARDFKSLVSACSTTAAYFIFMGLRPMCRCPVAVPEVSCSLFAHERGYSNTILPIRQEKALTFSVGGFTITEIS